MRPIDEDFAGMKILPAAHLADCIKLSVPQLHSLRFLTVTSAIARRVQGLIRDSLAIPPCPKA
jgi:hypothetical protein